MQIQYSVPIEPQVFALLEQASREERRDKSEIVSDLIRRHSLLNHIANLQKVYEPLARAAGYNSEEDIFRDVS
jgi:hypothetical protein